MLGLKGGRRVNNVLHKASKLIATIISEESVKPIIEKLTDLRERIKYGREMNWRGSIMCHPERYNPTFHTG